MLTISKMKYVLDMNEVAYIAEQVLSVLIKYKHILYLLSHYLFVNYFQVMNIKIGIRFLREQLNGKCIH